MKKDIKIKARSGIIIWITTLAMLTCTIVLAIMYNDFDGIASYLLIIVIMIVSTALTASFILRNYLLVTEHTITVCFGITTTVLNTGSIVSLKKVMNLTASASASVKRIEIQYDGRVIYVSPKDEEKFIKTICLYNPAIKYIEQ